MLGLVRKLINVTLGAFMTRSLYRNTLLVSAVIALLAWQGDVSPPANAQEIALEEIVVTARKRSESLQDIPVSVTVFSAEQIDRAGFLDLEDITMQTTGVQFNNELAGFRPERLYSNIRFRGVEGSEFSSLQTAALFVDGVFALQAAQSLSLMDLERVEVIKGPQSAQFGRNSFAGAINYVTRTPNLNEFVGKLQGEGSTHDSHEFQLSAEGPLVENKLSFRLATRLYQKGSMFKATDGGALGEQRSKSITGTLYAKPNDSWSLKARVAHQRDNDGPGAVGFFVGRLNDTCTGTTRPGRDIDGNSISLQPSLFLCGRVPDPGAPGAPTVDSNTHFNPQILATTNPTLIRDSLLNFPQVEGVPQQDSFGLVRHMLRMSLVSTVELENGVSITATGAYNDNDANNLRDWDMTNVEAWYVTNPQSGTDYSGDLRIDSSADGRLRWSGGFNYYEQDFLTSSNGGVFVFTCANFGVLGGVGSNCDVPGLFPVGVDGGDKVNVWGVYGSASYDITDYLTLDLEARYQEDKRGDGINEFSNTFKNFLPRAIISFKPNDDVNMYFNFSRGALPGVINSNIINCSESGYTVSFVDPRTGAASTSSECDQYREALGDGFQPLTQKQRMDAYEIGVKSTLFDGRATINVAGYWQKWADAPFNTFVTIYRDDDGDSVPNSNPNFFPVSTGGTSKYYGLELESSFILGDGWTGNFNVTMNENEFTEFTVRTSSQSAALGTRNAKGHRSARFPKWSGNLVTTYTAALYGDWEWYTRGDVMYQGKAVAGLTNLATLRPYFLFNLRAGLQRDALRVELFVKNLFDEKTWRTGNEFTDFSIIDSPAVFDFNKLGIILVPQDKRQVGIRTTVDF